MKHKAHRHVLTLLLTLYGVFCALTGDCGSFKDVDERTWHPPGYYANLTIDDPWLKEPYGHLSYKGFLTEMEKAKFHTTIAFIPWNFDRSKDDVAALFHDYPDRFSICIHGNNHDHYEFYKYETDVRDSWPAKPLHDQEDDIIQAIARMEKFRELTRIDYDRVMVFPHGIAPAKTLGLLKKYGFLSTVNAGNTPLGCEISHVRRAKNIYEPPLFENFVSLDRWSASDVRRGDVAAALSEARPLLFYAHHEFFENGIDAFNPIAEMVNTMEPRVQWKSLGYISRHLYLQKKRCDGNFDIYSFCRSLQLFNKQKHETTYFVRKKESFYPQIKRVTVNGNPYPYKKDKSEIYISVTIPANESRLINIEYENNFDPASVDISKNDKHINRLRELSDFRDMVLSKNNFGRAIVNLYYETGVYKLGLNRLAILLLLLSTSGVYIGWYLKRRYKRRSG